METTNTAAVITTHPVLEARQEKNPIPTRQLCKRCMKYSGLGFYTPAKTWVDVTDDRYQHLCLPCFVDMADERLIDWEPGLIIYGESMAHLRERQERVARGEYTDEGLTEWKSTDKPYKVCVLDHYQIRAGQCKHGETGGPNGEILCKVCNNGRSIYGCAGRKVQG